MAVRLLAGPFHLKDRDGVFPVNMTLVMYWPGQGLYGQGDWPYDGGVFGSGSAVQKVTFDGVCCRTAGSTIENTNQKASWWPKRKKLVSFNYLSGPPEMVWEPKVFMVQAADPPGEGLQTVPIYMNVTPYVRLLDRWVYLYGNRVASMRVGDTVPTPEGPVWPFNVFSGLRPGRTDEEVFARSSDFGAFDYTRCLFYDTETQQFSSPLIYLTGVPETVFYAPEWGVIITGHQNETIEGQPGTGPAIRIWSLEVEPQILTDPVVFIGTVRSGQIVTYRVRLTGLHNDPAPDELVDWTIEGVGELLEVQSKTDVEGYAIARVEYHVGETGDSIVSASVKC